MGGDKPISLEEIKNESVDLVPTLSSSFSLGTYLFLYAAYWYFSYIYIYISKNLLKVSYTCIWMSIRYFHFLYREFVFLLLTNDFSGCFGISISGFFFFVFLSYTFSSIHQPWNNGENRCFRRVREISVCLVRVVEFVIFLKIYGLISKTNRRYFFGFWFQCACGENLV